MIPPIDQLERLARLKADGLISEEELAAAKARLLADASTASSPPPHPEAPPTQALAANDADLPPIWRERFQLMDRYGQPYATDYRAALKGKGLWTRYRLRSSPLAFFFGPFYYLYLGLWRPALVLLALTIAGGAVLDDLGATHELDTGFTIGVGALYAACAIQLYYLRRRHGINRWNPFVLRSVLSEQRRASHDNGTGF